MKKRWVLSIVLSLTPIIGFVGYYYLEIQKAVCLSSSGVWLNFYEGCEIPLDSGFYVITIPPSVMLATIVIWGALIVLIYFLLGRFQEKGK